MAPVCILTCKEPILEKRSLSIASHRTSLALEPEFWAALEARAAARNISLSTLVRQIDEARSQPNLSSAIRVAVLGWYRPAPDEADNVAPQA
jgi:predicted DNA-binding ribbon-helix-helix protein